MVMTFEQQIQEAKAINWATAIKVKTQKLIEESKNDIDLYIKIINGDFQYQAHEEFCTEKAAGLYDNQNIRIA